MVNLINHSGFFAFIEDQLGANPIIHIRCVRRAWHNATSFVCVCNSTYCDQPEEVGQLGQDRAVLYMSEPFYLRLERFEVPIKKGNGRALKNGILRVRVNASEQYQEILGFGGAFTDAAGYNMNKLSTNAQMHLMRSYFDKDVGKLK